MTLESSEDRAAWLFPAKMHSLGEARFRTQDSLLESSHETRASGEVVTSSFVGRTSMVFDNDRLNVFQRLSLEASLCIFWFLIGDVATPRRHWPGDTCSSHELCSTGPTDNDVGVEDLAGEVEPLVGHS